MYAEITKAAFNAITAHDTCKCIDRDDCNCGTYTKYYYLSNGVKLAEVINKQGSRPITQYYVQDINA